MSALVCATPSCDYPTRGATVCTNCIQVLRRDLAAIPDLIDELHTTLSRQDRLGSSGGRRGAETALPWKEPASEALWVLFNAVLTWARAVTPAGQPPHPDAPVAAARWLLANLDDVVLHPDAGDLVDEVAAAVRQVYDAIDRRPDLLLAGQCGNDGCEEYLYAGPAARTTTCRACGAEHTVEERREWMMQYAAGLFLPANVALGWIAMLMGKTIPRGTWDSWVARHRITAAGKDSTGVALFRFGDVRDLAAEWAARPRKGQAA